MDYNQKEKKNEQMGAIISVGSHILVILLFFFMVAWRAPDPPMPEIGIELNFGLADAGSGDIQPEINTQPEESESEEEAAPDGLEETPEEIIDETTEKIAEEPVEAVEPPTEEVVTPIDNVQDSPDVVEQQPDPVVKEEQKEEVEIKEEETPKKPPVLYPTGEAGSGGKDGENSEAQNANQGDKDNTVGDQGDKDGTIDARAQYGNKGGGGSSLNMSGWMWDSPPDPEDISSESGKIVYIVEIDDKGNVTNVKIDQNTVSPTLEKIYRDEVYKLTFSSISGTTVAAKSTGYITFVIKAR